MMFSTEQSSKPRYLVLGAGGQIGTSLSHVIPSEQRFPVPSLPWREPHQLASLLPKIFGEFATTIEESPWAVIWVAGAAVVASNSAETERELATFDTVLESLRDSDLPEGGVFFFGSSAGGVFAGSVNPPFSDETPTAPIGPYGQLKLAQEELARKLTVSGWKVIIGRIANVYGPGQDPEKPQGIVTQLCRAAAIRKPLNVYVPLETLRDYIYADDAALAIHRLVDDTLLAEHPPPVSVEIIASGQPVTLSTVIRQVSNVTHRHLPLGFADAPEARRHARDLRLLQTPRVAAILQHPTPLAVGIRRTYDGLVTQKLAATLP